MRSEECHLIPVQSYVFNYQSGTDLCSGSYYTNAIPIVSYVHFY
jgi:hypothetical protein